MIGNITLEVLCGAMCKHCLAEVTAKTHEEIKAKGWVYEDLEQTCPNCVVRPGMLVSRTQKWMISRWLRSIRNRFGHEDYKRLYWESYNSWANGGGGWDRYLGLGGTDTMTALIWYQHIHKPGSKEWRPTIIIKAMLPFAIEWDAEQKQKEAENKQQEKATSVPAYLEHSKTPVTVVEWAAIVQRSEENRSSRYDIDILMGEVVRLRTEVEKLAKEKSENYRCFLQMEVAYKDAKSHNDKLQGNVTQLEAALKDIEECGTYDGHSEECETEWESVHEARFAEVSEEEIEADLRKNCNCPARQSFLAEKALHGEPTVSQ